MTEDIKKITESVLKYSDKQLKNFLSNPQNVIVLYKAIHLQVVPKILMDRIFIDEHTEFLFNNKCLCYPFKYSDIYNIMYNYSFLRKLIAYTVSFDNKYELVDCIDSNIGLDYLLLALSLKPTIDRHQIDTTTLKRDAYCSIPLINYIRFKQGHKKTFSVEELIDIINDRFNTNFSSLEEIANKESLKDYYFFSKKMMNFIKKGQ